MRCSTLNFHITRDDGLEFVFSSGPALAYPTHTHVSSFTVTLVRRGVVNVQRPTGNLHYCAGEVYVDAPHEPHSPAYKDDYDVVSLCIEKTRFAEMSESSLSALYLDYAAILVDRKLLAPGDSAALLSGISRVFNCQDEMSTAETNPVDGLIGGLDLEISMPKRHPGDSFTFLRRFKKVAGLTPHQFLVQNRIRAAKKLLAAECTPAVAALEAGFYDQSHMNRWFRRNIGLTPREYRNSCHFLD